MKRIIIATVFLAVACNLSAQRHAGKFSLIPRIGVNWSKTTDNQYWGEVCSSGSGKSKHYPTDTKVGIVAGLDADYMFTEWVGGSFGVTYSNEGFKLEEFNELAQSLKYLDISALAGIRPIRGLALKSGIQYGILLGACNNEKHSQRVIDLFGDVNDNKDSYHTGNISIPIAASYEYKNFMLELRYNLGLSSIGKYSEGYRTKSLWLTLGYRFEL